MMNNKALTLCPRGTDLVAARENERNFLKAIPEEAGVGKLMDFVVGACILRGTEQQEVGMALTASALWDQLRKDYPNLTIQEVGHAIKNGCYEKYGDVYGINAVSLYKMVEGYVHSEEAERIIRRKEEQKRIDREKVRQFVAEHPGLYPSSIDK